MENEVWRKMKYEEESMVRRTEGKREEWHLEYERQRIEYKE